MEHSSLAEANGSVNRCEAGGRGDEPLPPALAAQHIEVHFGSTAALKDVTLQVERGTIHALVGQNGAGKSTFLGVVAGRLRATRGDVAVYGTRLLGGDPRAARRAGVATIYQELAVTPAMTAVANVFLGTELSRRKILDERSMRDTFNQLCGRLGVRVRPGALMRELSVGDQQSVEIMRGLQAGARLLLLDEPTSALQLNERERLFEILRDIARQGVANVFVTHDLDDALDLADTVSVFRDGQLVSTAPRTEWTRASVVAAMLGRSLAAMPYRPTLHSTERPVLEVRCISVPGILHDISFSVGRGEIVGLGGLAGSGRSALLRTLAGVGPGRASGTVEVSGHSGPVPRSAAQAAALRIALVPEDRKAHGLVLGMTALENICLPEFAHPLWGKYSQRATSARAVAAAKAVGFDPQRLQTLARDLSGGNQQKLLLARWAGRPLNVLLADEPTRGVDVGAKAEILETLRKLAASGLAVVIVSSEFEELEALADRVLVLAGGQVVTTLARARGEVTAGAILAAAFGTGATPVEVPS